MRKTVRLLQLPQIFGFDAWCFDFQKRFEKKKMKGKNLFVPIKCDQAKKICLC